MGVWIETFSFLLSVKKADVTPCMGVWIETCRKDSGDNENQRHTLYGCVD